MDKKCGSDVNISNNGGFSIVELLVAVTILAIVFTPVLKSFTTAAFTNSRAQKVQNATSLAEDIMESVKGASISTLYDEATSSGKKIGGDDVSKDKILFLSGTDADNYIAGTNLTSDSGDYDSPPYVIKYTDVTATKMSKYNVEVKIDAEAYSHGAENDASNINSVALPQLYDIQDSKDHIILSWEMSKYDSGALNNLVELNAVNDDDIHNNTVKNVIKDKTQKITTITLSGSGDNVDVSCDITYKTGVSSYPKEINYNVYTGHLKNLPVDALNNGGPHIYLFYVMSAINTEDCLAHEIINIEDGTSSGIHDVYLMVQNNGKINNLKYSDGSKKSDLELQYGGNTIVKRVNDAYKLTKTKWDKNDDETPFLGENTFYTNLKGDTVQGQLFGVKEKNRLYEVTVDVYNSNDNSQAAHLVSSINTGDEVD